MAVSIHQLIAAISPDIYCHRSVRRQVRQTVHDSLQAQDSMAYLKAAEVALPVEPNSGSTDAITLDDPFSLEGLKHPVVQRTFVRDAMAESLEAFYFRLLELFGDDERWRVTKLVDNFEPSPSSVAHPYFAKRILESRQQADTLIESSRTLLRSTLQAMDKLWAQQEILGYYRDLESKDEQRRAIATSFLKQHWLETVEKRRGNMSLLRLSAQFPQREMLSQFMDDGVTKQEPHGGATDWLDHTLTQRHEEFGRWLKRSEIALAKQIAVQQTQLQQDVHRLKLHARWLKPLLDQGNAASSIDASRPALVSGFNTMVFTLLVLAQGTSSAKERTQSGELPRSLIHPKVRRYQPVLVLEMDFRATRNRLPGIRGKIQLRLTSYGLSEEELKVLRREVEHQELGETVMAIDSSAQEMVSHLMELVDDAAPTSKTSPAAPEAANPNPFGALLSLFIGLWRWLRGTSPRSIGRDSHLERIARATAIADARRMCELAFEALKQRR